MRLFGNLFVDNDPTYTSSELNLLMEHWVQQWELGRLVKTAENEKMYHKIMSHRTLTDRGTVRYGSFNVTQ